MNAHPFAAWVAVLLLAAPPAQAHSEHAHQTPAPAHSGHGSHAGHAPAAAPAAAAQVEVTFPDVELRDADGRSVRLRSEVFGDRIVVIDYIYTSCTTVCPVVSAILARVQGALGERAGREVQLVSLSIDPQRDTPAQLKRYGAKHGTSQGWTWLTGAPARIEEVLRAAGTYTPNFEDHPSVIMVGDPRSGRWTRHYGFVPPEELLARVEALMHERAMARGARGAP